MWEENKQKAFDEIKTLILNARLLRYCNVVVRGDTLGSTNQKAGFRSRGTNGPISVKQKVM